MHTIALLAFCVAAGTAVHADDSQRIAGGSFTAIETYPTLANLLYTWNWSAYLQACGGTILNNRSILTGAHCPRNDPASRWRVRLGSTSANSGGIVYLVSTIIIHHNFDLDSMVNDVAILRTTNTIAHNNAARPAYIAGANYNLADNQVLWVAGWGQDLFGASSEQLRHVQTFTINQATCRTRYAARGITINDHMMCSGWLDVGFRDQCNGDSGGPLYHNGVVVGIYSFAMGCGHSHFPSVNARVSSFTSWIQSNA